MKFSTTKLFIGGIATMVLIALTATAPTLVIAQSPGSSSTPLLGVKKGTTGVERTLGAKKGTKEEGRTLGVKKGTKGAGGGRKLDEIFDPYFITKHTTKDSKQHNSYGKMEKKKKQHGYDNNYYNYGWKSPKHGHGHGYGYGYYGSSSSSKVGKFFKGGNDHNHGYHDLDSILSKVGKNVKGGNHYNSGHGYYGQKGGKGGYSSYGRKGGKGSKSAKSNNDYFDEIDDAFDDAFDDDYCYFDDLTSTELEVAAEVCVPNFLEATNLENLNIGDILSCDNDIEDEINERYSGCSGYYDYGSEPNLICETIIDSVFAFLACMYPSEFELDDDEYDDDYDDDDDYNYDYCITNDEDLPTEVFGCVEIFAGNVDDLSFDDIKNCQVNFDEDVLGKCPAFFEDSDDVYNDSTIVTTIPANDTDALRLETSCGLFVQCAGTLFVIDDCAKDNLLVVEGYNILDFLRFHTSFPADDALDGIYDGSVDLKSFLTELEEVTETTDGTTLPKGFDRFIDCISNSEY